MEIEEDLGKRYFGPTYEFGTEKIYLASLPKVKIQSGGEFSGKCCLFIEFFGCNLYGTCGSLHCNAKHSFYSNEDIKQNNFNERPNRVTYKNIDFMLNSIFDTSNIGDFNHIVISGGEPLLWQLEISELLKYLKNRYNKSVTVEIETNGTIPIKTEYVDWFRLVYFKISPPLHTHKNFSLISQILNTRSARGSKEFDPFDHNNWIIKFLYINNTSETEILNFLEKYTIANNDKIYICAEKSLQNIDKVIKFCIEHGFNFFENTNYEG